MLQNFRACLPLGQQERHVKAIAKDSSLEGVSLIQTNKQLFSESFLGFKPQLTGQLCSAQMTEVTDMRLWYDNKEKSGMWFEVYVSLGMHGCLQIRFPWIPKSQKVHSKHCASKSSEPETSERQP